jgi:hypothetical protein
VTGLIGLWLGLLALIIFVVGRPGQGGGLTLGYFLGLSLIHMPGALLFVGQSAQIGDSEATRLGLQLTLTGLSAFVAGAALVARRRSSPRFLSNRRAAVSMDDFGWKAVGIGVLSYFVFLPLARYVPSLTSVVAAFAKLLIIGIWVHLYNAERAKDGARVIKILALLPLLPMSTLVTGGFLGYGIYWVLSIVSFYFVITNVRKWFYVLAPIVVYVGLCLFVAYMGERVAIRDVVWEQEASIFDRVERAAGIIPNLEPLDVSQPAQATAINDRLNQNMFVALAIERHESGFADFARGGTVPLWALVPRAVWPGKPDVGGGRSVVADFTGLHLSESTSFGAGQVLEFYVNFGVIGVIIGFLIAGGLFMWLDRKIMRSLAAHDLRGLLFSAMFGLALLQPEGNLLEMLVQAAASLVATALIVSLPIFRQGAPIAVSVSRGGAVRPERT